MTAGPILRNVGALSASVESSGTAAGHAWAPRAGTDTARGGGGGGAFAGWARLWGEDNGPGRTGLGAVNIADYVRKSGAPVMASHHQKYQVEAGEITLSTNWILGFLSHTLNLDFGPLRAKINGCASFISKCSSTSKTYGRLGVSHPLNPLRLRVSLFAQPAQSTSVRCQLPQDLSP